MTTTPPLVGEHLQLRPLRPDDLETLTRIYTSPVLTRYLGVDRMTPEQAATTLHGYLTRPDNRRHVFALCTPHEDTMHGTIGLLVEDYGSNAMITGLVILPGSPLRGHGAEAGRLLLTYAFGPLGLHRVWAGHRSDHMHMSSIMRATGLHPEATLRELFRTQGRWHNVITYAALAPRWRLTATDAEIAILNGHTTSPMPAQHTTKHAMA
jgi:[ribosomal protein S5]-alanine N-acetyltransferase